MDCGTTADLRQKIHRHIDTVEWRNRDKEIIAGLYIRLYRTDPDSLSDEEKTEAGKYCKTACYAALFGTSSLDFVPVYSRYARLIDTSGQDPFLEFACLRSEAMAAIRLGGEGTKKLRQALQLLRKLQKDNPDTTKVTEKITSTLLWLARDYLQQNRLDRASRICDIASAVLEKHRRRKLETADWKKIQLFRAHLLLASGKKEEAAALILEKLPPDNKASMCVREADLLYNAGCAEEAEPYLQKAIDHYSSGKKNYYEDQLTLQSLLLARAIRRGSKASIREAYARGLENISCRKKNLAFPESLETLLGESSSFFSRMISSAIELGDFDTAVQTVEDSYWKHPDAGGKSGSREERILKGALTRADRQSGKKNRTGQSLLGEGEDRIIFHTDGNRIYRLSNINGRKDTAVIEWERNRLKRELSGLLGNTRNPAASPGLFSMTVAYFRDRLFSGLEAGISASGQITITANAPLSSVPWPLFSGESRLYFRPGNSRRIRRESAPADTHFLSLAEDGSTLPMAVPEQKLLSELYPGGTHLAAGPSNKKTIIRELEECSSFHFAGHGYIHNNYPEKTGLVLSGSPPDISPECLLSFQEIRNLNLGSISFAFLNSCSSGRGRDYIGGIQTSAASAFLEAGVRSLIVSCNPVMDSFSVQFTGLFYKAMLEERLSPEDAFFRIRCQAPEISAPYVFIKA